MMLYLSQWLSEWHDGFGVLRYITLRAVFAALTAMAVSLIIGPRVIRWLANAKLGQQVRDDGPQTHLGKRGTPTMGGALILITALVSSLLWTNLEMRQVWFVVFVMASFGAICWGDDYRKVILCNSDGLSAKSKIFWQSLCAIVVAVAIYTMAQSDAETALLVPFFKNFTLSLGLWFIPLAYLVIVGSSNAVNLTDGLDGLAILPTVLVAGALGIFAYVTGHGVFADYLDLPHIVGVGEIMVISGALGGAGLGFLWFNTYPAQVFMGDVGALALGATLGVMAILVRQELVFFIMGGVFVMETVSVILQVVSFRLTGRRIFRMAPLHHHFELKGWPEPRVIVRFWIITVVLVLIGLSTLKIR